MREDRANPLGKRESFCILFNLPAQNYREVNYVHLNEILQQFLCLNRDEWCFFKVWPTQK